MSARRFSQFRETKVRDLGGRPKPGTAGEPGAEAKGGALSEKTAKWPNPTPHWKGSFNSATKVPVVKTRAAKGGVD